MNESTPIREICEQYGLTQAALANQFGIPLRTVEQWCTGRRQAPDYVVAMILTILEYKQKEGEKMNEHDKEHLDLDIDWSVLTEEEQLTLHQLLAKAHTAYCHNEQKEK